LVDNNLLEKIGGYLGISCSTKIGDNRMNEVILDGFPEYWPDELNFNTCARVIKRLRFPSRSSAMQELFGARWLRPIVDLPSRLDYLAAQIPASYRYTADYIINACTLAPYYVPFRTPDDAQKLWTAMKSMGGTALTMFAGLGYASVSRPAYLRYCCGCMRSDRQQVGEAYFHRVHQVPGITVCPIHACFIQDSSVLTHNLTSFITAEDANLEEHFQPIDASSREDCIALRLATDAQWLLAQAGLIVGPELVAQKYYTACARRGLLTKTGNMSLVDVVHLCRDYYPERFLEGLNLQLAQES
jgi:hypothetical protein